MLEWITENLATAVVAIAIGIATVLATRKMAKDKRTAKAPAEEAAAAARRQARAGIRNKVLRFCVELIF